MNTHRLWKAVAFSLGVFALFIVPTVTLAAAPTASTLSPVDGATGVSSTANLVITFSESVTATTTISSFVTIKKTSDDSTAEAIDVSGGQVSGSGSATITINPSITLIEGVSYYVQIDDDAFFNGTDEYYAGISNSTTWNFIVLSGSPAKMLTVPPAPSISVRVSGTTAAVEGAYSGSGVVTNEVGFTYVANGDTETVTFSGSPSSFQYIVRGLACGQTYTFKGYAKNSLGTTDSDEVEVTAEDCVEEAEATVETTDETEVSETSTGSSTVPLNTFVSLLLSQAPNNLSVGNAGLPVAFLQAFLMAENSGPATQALLRVGATAYFGPLTRAALAEYQAAHNIVPARGYYGPITRNYIQGAI
jgi:methionine-rich copper-binding protein CopC